MLHMLLLLMNRLLHSGLMGCELLLLVLCELLIGGVVRAILGAGDSTHTGGCGGVLGAILKGSELIEMRLKLGRVDVTGDVTTLLHTKLLHVLLMAVLLHLVVEEEETVRLIIKCLHKELIYLVLQLEYSVKIRSIPLPLMPWLIASPGHQHQWY